MAFTEYKTERYCLYAESPDKELFRAEIHHVQWPLQRAEAEIQTNQMVKPFGIELDATPALLHFAPRIDVVVWPIEHLSI